MAFFVYHSLQQPFQCLVESLDKPVYLLMIKRRFWKCLTCISQQRSSISLDLSTMHYTVLKSKLTGLKYCASEEAFKDDDLAEPL